GFFDRVNRDLIPVFDQTNRAADGGLGRNMSDHEAVTAPGEAPVGDERDVGAEAASHERARRAEHLAHSRPSARPLVADDDDVALLHTPGEDRRRRPLLPLEDARTAREALAFLARELRHGPLRGEI